MKLLSGVGLGHSYDYPLFSDINISISNCQSVAILGTSGCGKSTLIHILSTLLKPKFGEVFYNKKSIYSLSNDELLRIRRLDFGIIFQSHYLFKGFSAAENIELSSILSGKQIDNELLNRLGIDGVLNQKVGSLSGGQQQRVSIARVLAKQPRIIFADEPTGNLDKNTANEVMGAMFEYIKKYDACLMLVTHDENIAKMCDFRYRLENGVLTQE
ncbi:ABC transporter ATP-binding protein [Campylobacter sp. 19-13652]|uniref:ABC transporter ATP-binding protein n=1 Tax=Campylobacter sp. 19-13652 TaxID=2840180 RepID=UPI001C7699BE|nr:ABC transporter ATP-binding protein [Campylobacter sp. 19-13652]BCX79738.1 ABC transporter ATP-binding protein [Campylobacter sp. 19-13652]